MQYCLTAGSPHTGGVRARERGPHHQGDRPTNQPQRVARRPFHSLANRAQLPTAHAPSVCSFPHSLHFSQPTQSMMRVMLTKAERSSSRRARLSLPFHSRPSSNGMGHEARRSGEDTWRGRSGVGVGRPLLIMLCHFVERHRVRGTQVEGGHLAGGNRGAAMQLTGNGQPAESEVSSRQGARHLAGGAGWQRGGRPDVT